MSMYMSFFIRGKDDTFYPIGTYDRCTVIYEILHDAGFGAWEKINPVSINLLNIARHYVTVETEKIERSITNLERDCELIASFNNSVEEKCEQIDGYRFLIEENRQRLKELQEVQSFCWFLETIIEERLYGEDDELNENEYLYAGVEICHPTVEDIVK